jgi:hypothetical protein
MNTGNLKAIISRSGAPPQKRCAANCVRGPRVSKGTDVCELPSLTVGLLTRIF